MQPQPPQTPYQQPPQSPYRAPATATAGTNQMAIISVIAGVAGWVAIPIAASIVAIVCGHMARSEIRKTGQEGDGLAILGMVLGYAHLALSCFAIAMIVVIYGGFAAFFLAHEMG